ncbi:MAG: MCE family protein [Bernardetiaceae bacterium]|nr:MCE family protein [Bernardetiaceae bacterium]
MSKEFKVGLLAIIAGALLYLGFNFLKGKAFFKRDYNYYVVYEDVDGLTVSNQIVMNGLAVGRVDAIEMRPDMGNKLLVTINVDKDIKMGKGTKAMLADGGLLGGKVINLDINPNAPFLKPKDTLAMGVQKGIAQLVADRADPIAENLDSTLVIVSRMLREYEGIGKDVRRILVNVEGATNNVNAILTENRSKIKDLTNSLNELAISLTEAEKELQPILRKGNTLMDSLNSIPVNTLVKRLDNIMAEVEKTTTALNDAEGSLGKLMHNDSLYNNLNFVMEDLDRLLIDIREHPKRYIKLSVFGGKDDEKPEARPKKED